MPTIDLTTLSAYKAKNLLRSQPHPTLPLQIWNYSQLVQAKKGPWDEITTMCRGLIVDTNTGEIIARAFPKFWNDGERVETTGLMVANPSLSPHTVYEKLDGSLGILFQYNGKWIISSRGSFISEQAMKATEMLDRYDLNPLDPTVSYIMEIIYPQNRIVVDYGVTEALYFLAAFKPSGEEVNAPEAIRAGFPPCPSYPELATMPLDDLKALNWPNREGFVVRYETGHRVKVKFPAYLDLHRTATVSATVVFVWFCERKPLADLLESTPDEFHAWVIEQWHAAQQSYNNTLQGLQEELAALADLPQKEFAARIATHPKRAILFLMKANRDPFVAICRSLPPPKEETKWKPSQATPSQSTHSTPPLPFKQIITLMIGTAGSGKSTVAAHLVKEHPKTLIVSRDHLRESFKDPKYYESPLLIPRENLITEMEHAHIHAAAAARFHVIIDDTNLSSRVIKGIMERHSSAIFDYLIMDTPVDVAIQRCAERERKVSAEVIRMQAEKLEMLRPKLAELFETRTPTPIRNDPSLPSAIIVDIDGTLAHMTGRNAYDYTRVEEDTVDPMVRMVMAALPHTKILCSGRGEEAREGTERWLAAHHIPYAELHMRPHNDHRPDTIVKEEMWRALTERYHIEFMLDDRQCVVDHGRRLGFKVWQVQEGNF